MGTLTRNLGKSGIEVSAMGLGCWAIGGVWFAADGSTPLGWGEMDDDRSGRAIQAAIEHGITLFDTADVYGCGHSEYVLGEALEGRRNQVVLATKFGNSFNEKTRIADGVGASPDFIRNALENSLRRLKTDYIDLYQFHDWGYPAEKADEVRSVLEELVREGKIRAYGWSTDLLESVKTFSEGPHCATAQLQFNIFEGNPELLDFCENRNLSVLCRSPLAMGLLSAKYDNQSILSGKDIRNTDTEWLNWFKNGKPSKEYLARREAAREILTSGGRSLVQGALAWLWGRSRSLIPIPGFKNEKQAVENAAAMEFGALKPEQVQEVESLVGFTPLFKES